MTPEEFADTQRKLLESNQEQNKHLSRIGDGLQFLAWVIAIAIAVTLLSMLKR
jgi:hypothetical protein